MRKGRKPAQCGPDPACAAFQPPAAITALRASEDRLRFSRKISKQAASIEDRILQISSDLAELLAPHLSTGQADSFSRFWIRPCNLIAQANALPGRRCRSDIWWTRPDKPKLEVEMLSGRS
jgi:hypothetical protein